MVLPRPMPAGRAGVLSVAKVTRRAPELSLVLIAAAALCACHKPPATRSAVATHAATNDQSLALPLRKAGLWLFTRIDDGQTTLRGRTCVDAKTAAVGVTYVNLAAATDCSEKSFTRDADGTLRYRATCPYGRSGGVSTVSGVVSGDLSTTFSIHEVEDISGLGDAQSNGHGAEDQQWTYLGPCPSDLRPGDVDTNTPGGFPAPASPEAEREAAEDANAAADTAAADANGR